MAGSSFAAVRPPPPPRIGGLPASYYTWDESKWARPPQFQEPLVTYRRLLRPEGGVMIHWNDTAFPCWRRRTCEHAQLQRVLRTPPTSNRSCSHWLQAKGCYDLPDPIEHEPTRHIKDLLKNACGRLAPRDECSCQPCFTECRRSAVCDAGAPLPALPSRGTFAYAIMLVRSSDAAVAEGAEWAWINRYVKGAFRTVLSLRGVKTAHPVVLLTNLTDAAILQPFREQGVRVSPVPESALPTKPSKACGYNPLLCRRNARTYVKLGFFALTEFDKVIALDTDIIVHRNIDHLFGLATPAAVTDPNQAARGVLQGLEGGYTTHLPGGVPVFPFNSGVLLLRPSLAMHARMLRRIDELPSHDGGDQGFVASFFAAEGIPWYELPRRYNLAFMPQPDEIRTAYAWHALHGLEHSFDYEPHARAVLCNLSVACHQKGICRSPRCTRPKRGRRRRRKHHAQKSTTLRKASVSSAPSSPTTQPRTKRRAPQVTKGRLTYAQVAANAV